MPYTGPSELNGGNLYFSFRIGLVRVITITPYIDTSPGSPQSKWLEQDLAAIDRQQTPWVCVVMHGPWYNSNTAHQDKVEPHFKMRRDMEDLLFANQVDLVISGTKVDYFHLPLRSDLPLAFS